MKYSRLPGWLTPLAFEILQEQLEANPDMVVEKAKTIGLEKWIKGLEEEQLEMEQAAFRALGGSPRAAVDAIELQDQE
jgi:hypothetical protein